MALVTTTNVEPGIVLLTITRPERRNALSMNTVAALHRELDGIAADPTVRVVVLTGEGLGFCAGADVKAGPEDSNDLAGVPGAELLDRVTSTTAVTFAAQDLLASLAEKIHRLPVPIVAAVNGDAHGGGFALALACDIRIASETATFGAVFIKRGVSACDMGTSYHLPRLVGASRSAELLLTGRVFGAAEARDMGLVTDVVPFEEVVGRALAKAREIAANPPLAVWMTKETMWQNVDAPNLRHAINIENRTQVMCTATGELTEAFRAFIEMRPAVWQDL
jgi:enoyl-CoA hydratase